jgi:hypothetical protein
MAMEQARLWSLSSLATELRPTPRTVAKALSGVAPDGKIGKRSGWFMATAASALQEYEARSSGIIRGVDNEDELLSQIAWLAAEVEAGMQRLRREPDRSRRLELLKTFGAKVGALDRPDTPTCDRDHVLGLDLDGIVVPASGHGKTRSRATFSIAWYSATSDLFASGP